jgi:glycerol-3-phosphate acyltransferase PlsY
MSAILFGGVVLPWAIYFVLGYILGSIPFGLVFTRLSGLGDIRAIGSKNIGATNVLRTGRKDLAVATLIADMLKGTAAVLIARQLANAGFAGLPFDFAVLAAGTGAFLGHVFPVWLRFKGGKGVATYIGVLLGVYWQAALAFGIVWFVTALISRYSSLSALVASVVTPVILYFTAGVLWAGMFAALSAVLIAKHKDNIARLWAGTEAKIGKNAAPAGN